MANTNKVKYGLTNVYYAVATIDASDNTATYGTPKRIPGAVNLSMDHQGDANTFYADNIAFFTLQGDAGYSGSLEIAQITDDFRKDILGEVADANGCLTEVANAPTVPFALLFQFDGDKKNTRHVLYNCTASKPSIAGETNTESITPKTDTLNLTAAPIHIDDLGADVFKSRALADDTPYDTWFSSVYQGTEAATGISLDESELSLTAGGNTAKLTATAVPYGSTVTWTSSDNSVAAVNDGVVIPLAAGSATITAKITVGTTDYTDTCAVTVTA
jgi:phi13 family phage major tail protein